MLVNAGVFCETIFSLVLMAFLYSFISAILKKPAGELSTRLVLWVLWEDLSRAKYPIKYPEISKFLTKWKTNTDRYFPVKSRKVEFLALTRKNFEALPLNLSVVIVYPS